MSINRNLMILLSGQLIFQIGDKVYLLALSYWILETKHSAALMGLVLFCLANTGPTIFHAARKRRTAVKLTAGVKGKTLRLQKVRIALTAG